ncbi:uncharacterized protein ACRADG_012585 [Cochliomyia hominivorax]
MSKIMRPHPAQSQQQQQQSQQFCALDNCLKQQQQHFLKNHQNLQTQQLTPQQNYHQHQLQQQHPLNHVLQQQQPPPPHMWNPHLNAACYTSQPQASNSPKVVNSNTNPNHLNLQNCRPFPGNRIYQHNPHPHYPPANVFSHNIPPNNQNPERMPLTAPNYAKLPPLSVVNQQRINECAGIPLISTASAHLTPGQRQRISRKQSHSPSGRNWPNIMPGNSAQNYAAAAQYAAAHAQGAPLMLNKQQQQKPEYWSSNVYNNNPSQHPQQYATKTIQYNSKQQDRTRTPLRYQTSAPAALTSSKSKENLEQQLKQTKDNENSSSTNGDSSNSNETCLPRIIKPRKRRKKDRKPNNNLVNAVYMKMDNKTLQDKSSNTSNNIKSYKSTEDLLKCLQKFTQITNLNESRSHHNKYPKPNTNYDSLIHNKTSQKFSSCSQGSGDINHGICFCNECDPLRSLWDYPLRRSLSDSSTSDTSGTGSLSDNNTTTSNDSSTECNWPKNRAEIVGVIGSKRNREQPQNNSYNSNHNNIKINNEQDHNSYNNNILSGINLASELFKHTNSSSAFVNLDNSLSVAEDMLLLPETAETLLTKSINEISKKLIETCSNESCDLGLSSCNSLSSFSTTSSNSSSANSTCADFSNDSGIESAHINAGDDLVFNFDNLHITTTTTKLSLTPSSLSSSSSSSASLTSSPSSSLSSSSCGNISMSSSPTVKFASNFLTSTSSVSTTATAALVTATTMTTQTPLTPSKETTTNITTLKSAPTLDFLVDLNNNHLHVSAAAPKSMIISTEPQHLQFNDLLLQNQHQPPHTTKATTMISTPTLQQHDQQFFNNCFDLMWQQHERDLGNNITSNTTNSSIVATTTTTATTNNTTNNNSNHIDQLTSSVLSSNNVAMSSFLDSVGSLKTVFSTIS